MARVIAPNGAYSGISAGVVFVKGQGECDDPARLRWFADHGYRVEETKKPRPEGRRRP